MLILQRGRLRDSERLSNLPKISQPDSTVLHPVITGLHHVMVIQLFNRAQQDILCYLVMKL